MLRLGQRHCRAAPAGPREFRPQGAGVDKPLHGLVQRFGGHPEVRQLLVVAKHQFTGLLQIAAA